MAFKIDPNTGRRFTSRRNAPTQVLNVVRRIRQLQRLIGKPATDAHVLGALPQPALQQAYRELLKMVQA